MFERKHQAIAPVPVFMRRLVLCFGIALLLILAALFIGVAGYHWIAGLTWIDSLLNASTGFIRAARHAGMKPDTTPVTSDTSRAMPTTFNDIVAGKTAGPRTSKPKRWPRQ